MTTERQLTFSPVPKVLTNVNVFSPDGKRIVYDTRSNRGDAFDASTIETVDVETGQIETIYRAPPGTRCGVATFDPTGNRVAFILGPTPGDDHFTYGPARRQGVTVDLDTGTATNLDARDLSPPFTPGALRGGTHVHVFSPDGRRVSSTYEDHVLDRLGPLAPGGTPHDLNQRTIAVSLLNRPVTVRNTGPRDHDGQAFTAVVTRTVNAPRAGSDEINRAFEEAWIGAAGYRKPDGTRQRYALAFQGNVVTTANEVIPELFVVDLPDDFHAAVAPLEGTATARPAPPAGCVQRRLTFTANDRFPGLAGPRHWPRSAPDGSAVAFLKRDDAGVARFHLVSPNGGPVRMLNPDGPAVASAFTWSPDGRWLAHVADDRVCVTDPLTGTSHPLTEKRTTAPAPQACVFCPGGKRIAFVRPTVDPETGRPFDQIWRVDFQDKVPVTPHVLVNEIETTTTEKLWRA